jgi:5,10-methenyltetrahydrofolate synthetase
MTEIRAPQSERWEDVRVWRRELRERFIADRLGTPSHLRRAHGEQAKSRLLKEIDLRKYETIGMYFPIRGEIDIRDIARKHVEAGGRVGLPVVVTRGEPVEFWNWVPGEPLQRGLWNIPIPERRELITPHALIVPVVGFDAQCYRLGYGGGYYDRTLAAMSERPFRIGFGYSAYRLDTIYPQPHDIPMNVIVTDHSIVTSRAASDMP